MVFKKGYTPWNKGKKTGQIPWNKGKRLSEDHKRKLSKAKEGKNNPSYGKRASKETRKKLSLAAKGKNNSMYGKSPSKETRHKLSEAQKGERNGFYGRCHTDEVKQKIREARLGRVFPVKDTSIEIALQEELSKRDIKYETHISVCNVCQPDIVFSDLKIVIFADGDYWHSLPCMIEKDRRQDKVLRENGWIVLRFWGREIRDSISRCVDEVEGAINCVADH